jgi:hypothetical protein
MANGPAAGGGKGCGRKWGWEDGAAKAKRGEGELQGDDMGLSPKLWLTGKLNKEPFCGVGK